MSKSQNYRIAHEYTQTNPAPPEKVFPLLCPVREAEWLPSWNSRLIYSESGLAELGCIFSTPNSQVAGETTWIVTEYDAADLRIGFVWITPGHAVAEIRIQLTASANGSTRTQIAYRYTGLSPEGNRDLATYTRAWFEEKMQGWETAINHYLETGTMIAA